MIFRLTHGCQKHVPSYSRRRAVRTAEVVAQWQSANSGRGFECHYEQGFWYFFLSPPQRILKHVPHNKVSILQKMHAQLGSLGLNKPIIGIFMQMVQLSLILRTYLSQTADFGYCSKLKYLLISHRWLSELFFYIMYWQKKSLVLYFSKKDQELIKIRKKLKIS